MWSAAEYINTDAVKHLYASLWVWRPNCEQEDRESKGVEKARADGRGAGGESQGVDDDRRGAGATGYDVEGVERATTDGGGAKIDSGGVKHDSPGARGALRQAGT
eukprot:2864813-Rhodomonas_salina.1